MPFAAVFGATRLTTRRARKGRPAAAEAALILERTSDRSWEIPLPGLDLLETALRQDVRGQGASLDAGGIDADGPLEPVDLRQGGVAVDDEWRPVPQVGPSGRVRGLRALVRLAIADRRPGSG